MAHSSLSDLRDYCSGNPESHFWMGLDVHKKSYSVAVVDHDEMVFTWTTPANPHSLVKQISDLSLSIETACFESGPTGFTLARVLAESEIPVIVAAPSKIPRSVSPGSKTDRLDCIKLARFAAKGLIRPIAVPTPREESERALLRRRHQLTDGIRRSKQRIRSMFLFHGIKEPEAVIHWKSDFPDHIRSAGFREREKQCIESHLRELLFLIDEQKRIDRQLEELVASPEHAEVYAALISTPGVGFVTGTTYHLEMFDPSRFRRAEEVASHLGLAPMVHHSGQKTPRGHLVPVGQRRLRSLLVEAAWRWIALDEHAKARYHRILSRTGIPQKAITAMARRLAIILWRLSLEQRVYRSEIAA